METIRISKLLSYQGIGSIVNLVDNGSVIIAGINHWNDVYYKLKEKVNDYVIHNERLEIVLDIKEIRKPLNLTDRDKLFKYIPAFRFPLWYYCPLCGKMKKLSYSTRKVPYCDNTDHSNKVKIIPIWFVLVCNRGHIKDFPFEEFVSHNGDCEKKDIYFETSKISSSTSNFYVKCKKCNTRNNLPRFSEEIFDCDGSMPWIGSDNYKAKCQSKMRIIPIHSSSLYSSIVVKALLLKKSENCKEEIYVKERYNSLITMDRQFLDSIVKMENFDVKKFNHYLVSYCQEDYNAKLFSEEYEVLSSTYNYSDNFITVLTQDFHRSKALNHYFKVINMIPSLTETIVFRGFSRIDKSSEHLIDYNKKYKWLPGTELYGEGIFIELNQELLCNFFESFCLNTGINISISDFSLFVIHSLSHTLIKELCKESGYLISEIREKIYVSINPNTDIINESGLLLYVTGSDRFGTLGGLCQLAIPEKFEKILINALINILHCTADPFCINQEIKDNDKKKYVNGSSCHHCMYIPETSCSMNNTFLDRSLLIGSEIKNIKGFFENLI